MGKLHYVLFGIAAVVTAKILKGILNGFGLSF